MRGQGLESEGAVVLAALDAARAVIQADEWRCVFEGSIYDAAQPILAPRGPTSVGGELQRTNGHRDAAEVAKEEMAKHGRDDPYKGEVAGKF